MLIKNRAIGIGQPPYIIAEISANHRGSVEEAERLMDCALDIGADAVKIQCYTAKNISSPRKYPIKEGPWAGKDLYELYKEAQTPPDMVKELFAYAVKHKITLFSSVFDEESLDLVVSLGAPAIKIASFELVDIPLVKSSSLTGLPLIISTGMGTHEEILDALYAYRHNSPHIQKGYDTNLALLHCISEYPSSPKEANLAALGPLSMIGGGNHVVGLSDHSLGSTVACAAVALGAVIVEKHLIMNRDDGGPDAGFSSEPWEFASMIKACRETYHACQSFIAKPSPNRMFRKSLHVVEPLACGELLTSQNVKPLRPALGLPPKLLPSVLGRPVTQAIPANTPLLRSMIASAKEDEG